VGKRAPIYVVTDESVKKVGEIDEETLRNLLGDLVVSEILGVYILCNE